ncbi:MAG TPA: MBOAT family O-acyltransferase [Ferruginibacter sp.]|nr:MBOAT family O-acyltransferase [Ferruginibacter sp.]HMP20200.1 MBOAT family O-acyltransferase [Ferruginibacter sp.]
MLFNSIDFLYFFIIVTTAYFALPHRYRWMLILAASCYFYMAFVPVYILILGFTIVVDYFAGIFIEQSEGKKRKMYLVASLIANIGVLAVFKYYNFLNDNLTTLLHGVGYKNPIPYLNILLPIGLSFHTFQAMSYTIEVYRGKEKAERHFGIYALYVMFYPQLVAGPIERPQNLLHQFHTRHDFDYDRVKAGLKLMLWGFFKKIVVADRLAIYVNYAYDKYDTASGNTLLMATFFFSIQMYCDFSGYSDIAIGSARVMGIKLMTNFKRPMFARTTSEFWQRWHISLSTWFKDYLYFPLGGSRVPIPRWYLNLMIVFLISGLWHGANWTFAVWGAINGLYVVIGIITQKWRAKFNTATGLSKFPRLLTVVDITIVFILVCLVRVFFRAPTIDQAMIILKRIFTFSGSVWFDSPSMMLYCFGAILLLVVAEWLEEFQHNKFLFFNSNNRLVRRLAYTAMVLLILAAGVFDGGQFIYFQF